MNPHKKIQSQLAIYSLLFIAAIICFSFFISAICVYGGLNVVLYARPNSSYSMYGFIYNLDVLLISAGLAALSLFVAVVFIIKLAMLDADLKALKKQISPVTRAQSSSNNIKISAKLQNVIRLYNAGAISKEELSYYRNKILNDYLS